MQVYKVLLLVSGMEILKPGKKATESTDVAWMDMLKQYKRACVVVT